MLKLLKNANQIITVNTNGSNVKRGLEMNDIGISDFRNIITNNGLIVDITNNIKQDSCYDEVIDLSNKIVLPGIVDCHTHTVFAGNRSEEFKLKIAGISYEEIAEKGGGISNTVTSLREMSFDDLYNLAASRIDYFISRGVTALEIKSGYGLSFYDEIKILQVIKALKNNYKIDIVPTFLGAHTIPREFKNDRDKYIEIIINQMLPYIKENSLATFCDVFCEATAFSSAETDKIFTAASKSGLKIKLHSDQFNNIGGIDVALKHNAVSVDHLEVIKEDDIEKISKSDTVCVLLPGVSFFLNYDFANAKALQEKNAIIAISTDFNPGSSHIHDINLIMSIAAIKMRMNIESIISAVTINAAKAIGLERFIGSIEIGKQADFSIFDAKDYSDIVYNVGKNLNIMTVKKGVIIYKNN
ncbi:MAG TPA: imidazolonepropionase [Melioribacteraceae bacterium]|nr:imidazolonepropionase [Melioribacteraceae bacterium]